jgi:serine/threonine protein kinase
MNDSRARDPAIEMLIAELADDFCARQARGEKPDPEEYAARHPAHAEEIRDVLSALRLVPPTAAQKPEPVEIGDYRIIRKVGQGAMGVVYEAEQKTLRRRVALKVLPFGALSDERMVKRFEHEARAAAKLDHPHVVKVFDFGKAQGTHYLAMQFVDGRPMSEAIHERRTSGSNAAPAPVVNNDATTVTDALADSVVETVPVAGASTDRPRGDMEYFKKVARWVRDAAAGLEHAAAKGVVHRDIKPGNLLVDRSDQVLVADFGLAKMIDCESGFTATGDILGTLRYMSPEQAKGKKNEVDHRSDIYSLGATLYELLTLTPAIEGNDKVEILRKIETEEPVALRKLDRSIPMDLETVVLKCMRKEAWKRYSTAQELVDDLDRFLSGGRVKAKRRSRVGRGVRWVRRRPAMTVAAIAIAFCLLIAGWLAVNWKQEPVDAPSEKEPAFDEIRTLLAQGQSVELIGPTGMPVRGYKMVGTREHVKPYLYKPTGEMVLESAGPAHMILIDNPGIQSYRIEAEVSQMTANPSSMVGIFQGMQEIETADGPSLCFAALTTNKHTQADVGPQATGYATVAIYRHLLANEQDRIAPIVSQLPIDPGRLQQAEHASPSLKLAALVHPERTSWFLGARSLRAIARPLPNALRTPFEERLVKPLAGTRVDVAPTGGIGVMVSNSSARFRRVLITPEP